MVPAYIVFKSCATRRGIEINHLALFSVGFVSYWILPIAVGLSKINRDVPFVSKWYDIFEDISLETLAYYLIISLFFYLFFCAGSYAGSRIFVRSIAVRVAVPFDRRLLSLYLVPGLLLSVVYAMAANDFLFRGYAVTDIMENYERRGTFIASSIFLLILALLNSTMLEQKLKAAQEKIKFRRLMLNRYFFAYFAVGLIALSMGGRLYFLSSVLMLLVYRTVYFQRIRAKVLLWTIFALVFGSAIIGEVRAGSSGIGISAVGLAMNVAWEPIATSFSLVAFLAYDRFRLLCWPVFLLNGFTNLIPSSLIPGKSSLMMSPSDYGFVLFAPGGATHSYFSFMINFGILGSFVAVFLIGMFLSFLRARDDGALAKTMYLMISGWLAFSFWRDGFSVSLVKLIFEFSILVPVFIVFSLHIITTALAPGLHNAAQLIASPDQVRDAKRKLS